MPYERNIIAALEGYVPGRQPARADVVKLNTNENPYPPCGAVMQALSDFDADSLRRYPPPTADAFRAVAATRHGVGVDNVIATNGSDELLRLAITTFVDPGQPIGIIDPSYSLYPVLAAVHGSPLLTVTASDDWSLPSQLAATLNAARVPLTMIVNPHAPSGRLTDAAELTNLARDLDGVLLLDEAYVDFVDPDCDYDMVGELAGLDNVLIARTLSKGYSLAGLRFGYGLASPALIEPMLTKTRDSYNVDVVAQRLAAVALEHSGEAAHSWSRVRKERARLTHALIGLGHQVTPSQTNFLLARVPRGRAARQILAELDRRGVLVRHFDTPGLDDCLRITVGTPEDNDRLIGALTEMLV